MGKFYNVLSLNKQNQHCAEFRQKACLYIRVINAAKGFAKFGWQTFCHKKVEKAVAKLESDRL